MPMMAPHYSNVAVFSALLIASVAAAPSADLVGINYGRMGDDLPPPESVPGLLHSIGVGRVRLYDADPTVLHAFSNSGVDVVVSLPNDCLAAIAANPTEALAWARDHVHAFFPAAMISTVVVGDEVLTGENALALAPCLISAMENLHAALATLGLERHIVVTSAHSLNVLATSYPPSRGVFRPDLLPYLRGLLGFHARTGSPFFIDALPYAAYVEKPSGIELDYALLDPAAPSFTDPATGLCYTNLLHAQVDAVHHAIAAATKGRRVEVRVSETGWPSAGDAIETGATRENAARYNSNLMRLLAEHKGTPLVPEKPLCVYIFALFNENQKAGPSSERNYGLFKPDCTPAYPLEVSAPPEDEEGDYTASTGCGGIVGGSRCGGGVVGGSTCGGGRGTTDGPGYEQSGYMSFSSASTNWQRRAAMAANAAIAVVTVLESTI